ncbi:hypothetical protein ACOSQ2_007435 [Xanthoceras sorbifolium]
MKCLPIPRPPTYGIFDFHPEAPAPHCSTASSFIFFSVRLLLYLHLRLCLPPPPSPSLFHTAPPHQTRRLLLLQRHHCLLRCTSTALLPSLIYLYSNVLCRSKYFTGESSAAFNCSFRRQIFRLEIWPIWPYLVRRPTV